MRTKKFDSKVDQAILREFDQAVKHRAEMHDAHGVNSPQWVKANMEVMRLRRLVLGSGK